MGKVALVTGGNQGLGFALVRGLCAALGPEDTLYLTARDPDKGHAAMEEIKTPTPRLRFARLDVREPKGIARLAATLQNRHGGVDIVLSNAAARIAKDRPQSEQVRAFVDTNNHGTYRMLWSFMPVLRSNARFVVVASSFGMLRNLPAPMRDRFDVARASMEDVAVSMNAYADAVEQGRAQQKSWPNWMNIPSKVGQVALAKVAARMIVTDRPGDGILINAACPGLVDTAASRPWFDDMSSAQSPGEAARGVLWLATLPAGTSTPSGELVQFRRVVPWL